MPIAMGTAILGAGALSAAGSMISSAFNVGEARKNRKFQEKMSSSAHQREMIDLKRAGLNPVLSGKYGGSSTPSGAQGKVENPLQNLPQTVTSAAQLKQARPLVVAQVNNQNSATAVNDANAEKIKQETINLAQEHGRKINIIPQELLQLQAQIKGINAVTEKDKAAKNLLIKQAQMAAQELHKLKITRKLYDTADQLTPETKTIIEKLKSIKRAILKRFGK